jgi:phage I-like protein
MKQQEGDSKKRIAFPIQLFAEGSADVQIPDVIQVVPVGKWDHPAYGEMEITSAHIAEFAQNFKDKVRLDIPINAGHDNGMGGGELPAIGWFTDVEDRGVNGLWAGVKWTDEGERLLKARAFKYFSPEFYQDYEDPETRKKYGHVLVGGALTNKPYFKELEPVVSFSEPAIIHQFTDDMNLKDILSKRLTFGAVFLHQPIRAASNATARAATPAAAGSKPSNAVTFLSKINPYRRGRAK